MCGLILIHTGISGFRLPNCSKTSRLSIFILTPSSDTSFISSIDTPLGVYNIFFGLTPALSASLTS